MERVRRQIEVPEVMRCEDPITVAVLDTGIGRHPDLEGKVLCFKDFVENRNLMYDDNGHGTHVCGIICGNGKMSAGKYRGVAPCSRLVVGKILDDNGDGMAEHMLAALQWIASVRQKFKIRVLNISVGIGSLKQPEKERELQSQVEALWNSGIVVVCAAGNKGPGSGSISAVGGSGCVITVGCHDGEYCRDDPGRCETYSGRGFNFSHIRKPDLVAPGTNVISCNAFYGMGYHKQRNPYIAKSGTSMATPIVAGAAALALQKYAAMTNEELKQKITISATDLQEPWNKQGWGMVNVRRLLE